MARFAANLTLLFNELPMLQRSEAAKRAGFQGVEILFLYDLAAPELRQAARQAGMDIVLINCPPPNWAGGPRGFAAVPGLRDRFQRDFERALRVAEALSARHIHIMSGKAEGSAAMACMIENLRWAANRAPCQPDDRADEPDRHARLFPVLLRHGSRGDGRRRRPQSGPAIRRLSGPYDHRRRALATWEKHGHRVHHIQIAGAPGRHEPREGDIDHPAFFR